jgi:tetratricopeptide (TPR) repeat protein
MPQISLLLKQLPSLKESRMVANGFGLWVAWKGDVNPSVAQTLTDYGGMHITAERHQSLWFFFSSDVFLALSRLEIWARLNPLPVFAQVFPAKLLLGFKLEVAFSVDTTIAAQESLVPEEFEVWLHPKAEAVAKSIPGLAFKDATALRGLASVPWTHLQADPRLPYQSSLGWFLVLKPLGNPLDKAFQTGWREFLRELEAILIKLRLRYLFHESYVVVPLETLKELRLWCREFLTLVREAKDIAEEEKKKKEAAQEAQRAQERQDRKDREEGHERTEAQKEQEAKDVQEAKVALEKQQKEKKALAGEAEGRNTYWPCVMAIINSKGLNFNSELPKKVPLDWDMLMPDFPHMSYKNAFLMGEGFNINDVRFSVEQSNVEDWCSISLSGGDSSEAQGTLHVDLPKRLVAGSETTCFYCGLRNHLVTDCPSRNLAALNMDAWESVARLNFDEIDAAFKEVEQALVASEVVSNGLDELLHGDAPANHLIQAIFEINAPVQLRMMSTLWRSRGKDYPKGLYQLGASGDGGLWDSLANLRNGEILEADRGVSSAKSRQPRNYQPITLHGFTALEKGDLMRTQTDWKESRSLSTTPLVQAYHMFLQGRFMELQGKFQNATGMYKEVLLLCPRWLDAVYRQGVCLVKMGFAEQAMGFFENLILRDPHMFNRTLIDPELERGHIHLLNSLYPAWKTAEAAAMEEKKALEVFRGEVNSWFPSDTKFFQDTSKKIDGFIQLAEIKNFVAFQRVIHGRKDMSRELQEEVEEETAILKERFSSFMERLKMIRDEAAWFPFPKVLVEFNRDFNYCAKNCNWGLMQHFHLSETFRKAHNLSEKVEETLKTLESRLKTLKIVRDSTLFLLIMGKTFFWLELTGLILAVGLLPLSIYYGQKMGYDWASGLVVKQKWQLQKGLIMILSVGALGLAIVRTALVFERKKEKLFKKLEEQAQK